MWQRDWMRLLRRFRELRAAGNFRRALALHPADVVIGLEVQPELRGGAEILAEADRGIDRDRACAADDFVDAARRNADVLGQAVFGDAQRRQEFFGENFAGRDEREQLFFFHVRVCSGGFAGDSVVIDNFDAGRALRSPAKALLDRMHRIFRMDRTSGSGAIP